MTEQYTPTTEEVEEALAYAYGYGLGGLPECPDDVVPEDAVRLWLAEEKADAWDRGYTSGFYDREKLSGDSRDASEGSTRNPYRK